MSVLHELGTGGEPDESVPVQFISPEARDWYLEEQYGRLAAEEIAILGIERHHMSRLAQLKMIAAHNLDTYDHDAYREWLRVYQEAIGPYDGNSA